MTISSTNRIAGPYIGNGIAASFPFSFKVFSTTDIQVVKLFVSSGIEQSLTLNTDYTVLLNTNQNSNPGGTITLTAGALEVGSNVTITSAIQNLQPTDLTNQGGFYPEVITDSLDRATIQLQQIADVQDRCLKGPLSDGETIDMEMPVASIRANRFLAFDGNGLPVASIGTGADSGLRADLGDNGAITAGAGIVGFRQNYALAEGRTVLARLRDSISIKDFGAVGDGIADDTFAFTNAVTSCGVNPVFIPAGTYKVTSTVSGGCFYTPGTTSFTGGGSVLNVFYNGMANVSTSTAFGLQALKSNTASDNVAVGYRSLSTNTTGGYNTAIGRASLESNSSGSYNCAVGRYSLQQNTIGTENVAVGYYAMEKNVDGTRNVGVGSNALRSITTGDYNTAVGYAALDTATSAVAGSAFGANSLGSATGTGNSAFGCSAGSGNTTGVYNTYLGYGAGDTVTTGSGNIHIGTYNAAGVRAPVASIATTSNNIVMGHTGITYAGVKVAWTVTSDARDKMNCTPVPHGLSFIEQLKPTAYQFREARDSDVASGPVRYGFIAQDVLAIEGDSPVIINTQDPEHLGIQTDALVPVLVNAIKDLKGLIELQAARIAALEARA